MLYTYTGFNDKTCFKRKMFTFLYFHAIITLKRNCFLREMKNLATPINFDDKTIIAMIHLFGGSLAESTERAKKEIDVYVRNGATILVENYDTCGDDAESLARCEAALEYLQATYPDASYGVNFLVNDQTSFALAAKYGASFVQVESVAGHLSPQDEEGFLTELQGLREKHKGIAVLGGVRFKYQPYLSGRTLEEDLHLGAERCDAIVASGQATGVAADDGKLEAFRDILPSFPIIVGSGLDKNNAHEQLTIANGAIVGSSLKKDGDVHNEVSEENVQDLMAVVKDMSLPQTAVR